MTIPQDTKHSNPHEQNLVHVKTLASLVVSDQEAKKASKKKDAASAKSSSLTKKQKLSQVKDDMLSANKGVGTEKNQEASEGADDGGLFGGFGDHWEPDPLTIFMFENAPVIIELCQRSQEAMVKAEVAQTSEQVKSAQLNAQATIEKGEAQAKQQNLQAAGEFAQAGLAAFQAGLQAKDWFAGDNTYAKNLDAHDQVVNGLNKGSIENEANAGSEESLLKKKDTDLIDGKVDEFIVEHKRAYKAELEALNDGGPGNRRKRLQTSLKRNFTGLNRSNDAVDRENELLSNRAASKQAYKKTFETNSTDIDTNSTDIDTENNFTELMSQHDDDGVQSAKSKDAQKYFMKRLFKEDAALDGSEPKVPLSMKQRMDYIGNWGGGAWSSSGESMQQEMLRTYGSTSEGVSMRENFDEERVIASKRADIESGLNQKSYNTRQLLYQTLGATGAKAVTDFLQKKFMLEISQDDASATIEASIGSMNAQAKGAEDAFIANSLKDMTGIFDWFQSMHGQLLSAQTSAAGV